MAAQILPLTLLACLAETLTMMGAFAFPAMLPGFIQQWGLTHSEAGWITGLYFAGYVATVPLLMGFTDRVDARRIWLLGVGLTVVAWMGFALFAEGFWSALCFHVVGGAGLAGTYMPGLKMVLDRIGLSQQGRVVAFYTACFSLGTASSFLVAGWVEALYGWSYVFLIAAGSALLAGVLVGVGVKPLKVERQRASKPLRQVLNFALVIQNRNAMGFIFAYGIHAWELFGMRTWLVAFLAFSLASNSVVSGSYLQPTEIATISAMIAMIASIVGQELARVMGAKQMVTVTMLLCTLVASGLGFTASWPYLLVIVLVLLYSIMVQLDSSALTAAVVAAATPKTRGVTLAVHSMVGFVGGIFGPLAMGIVLDLSGDGEHLVSWGLAFASLGVVGLLGPAALHFLVDRRGG